MTEDELLAQLPDLASRRVGGSVLAANDEFFAERENLIKPEEPVFRPLTFTNKGQEYDGWETRRRRRESGDHDWVIVRLGIPGIPKSIVVDTAFFKGNFPPFATVEGCGVDGYPDVADLVGADWETDRRSCGIARGQQERVHRRRFDAVHAHPVEDLPGWRRCASAGAR